MKRTHIKTKLMILGLSLMIPLPVQAQENQNRDMPALAYPHFQVAPRNEEIDRQENKVPVKSPAADRPDNNVTSMPPKAKEQFDRNQEANRRHVDDSRRRNESGDRRQRRDLGSRRSQDPDANRRGDRDRDRNGSRDHNRNGVPDHDTDRRDDRDHDRRHEGVFDRGHARDNRGVMPGGFVPQTPTGLDDDKNFRRDNDRFDHRRDFGREHRHYRYSRHRHGYFYDPITVINYGPALVVPDSYDSISYGGVNYYYNDGQFYVPSGGQLVDSDPPVGAVIMRLPQDSAEVLVGDDTYYVYAGVFYQKNGSGYQVIVPPFAQQTSGSYRENVTVRLPRVNGGYKEVYLIATSDGYRGPQDEIYTEFPSIDQLQAMYGE